jgi:hypothetical protein
MSNTISRMAIISKTLEDRFFFAENLVLKEQLARLKRVDESVEALSKVSGIVNKAVLKELVALDIRPEMLAALCLVPIIEVAWADGIIDNNEVKAVLNGAANHGFGEDHEILQEWLHRKPDAPLLTAWRTYMQGLCEILSKETLTALKADILEHTKLVAEASGGFLGLTNPISAEEQRLLNEIDAFFKAPGPCCQ